MMKISKVLLLLVVTCIVVSTLSVSAVLLYQQFSASPAGEEDYADEISRVKFFIRDWYDEISSDFEYFKVYFNELQFENGAYTLTVAGDRIRAVYPRGARFFQLQYITYIEFLEDGGRVICHIFYGDNEECSFPLKDD